MTIIHQHLAVVVSISQLFHCISSKQKKIAGSYRGSYFSMTRWLIGVALSPRLSAYVIGALSATAALSPCLSPHFSPYVSPLLSPHLSACVVSGRRFVCHCCLALVSPLLSPFAPLHQQSILKPVQMKGSNLQGVIHNQVLLGVGRHRIYLITVLAALAVKTRFGLPSPKKR